LRGKRKQRVLPFFSENRYEKDNYIFRILLFYCTCPNFGDKKERVLILCKFRAVSIDFSFLLSIWYSAIE
jgi:hypothetical protein